MRKAGILMLLLLSLMLTGCRKAWDERQSFHFPDADAVMAAFQEHREALEEMSELLLSKPEFWAYLHSRPGPDSLTTPSSQAPDYLNFFPQEEWDQVLLLYSDMGVRNLGVPDFDGDATAPLGHICYHFLIDDEHDGAIQPAIQLHYVSDLEAMPDACRPYRVNGTLLWQEGHWFARRYPASAADEPQEE